MKTISVYYYGEGDVKEAVRLAKAERESSNIGITRDASAFNGELEMCNKVVVMPNVRGSDRAKIVGAYRGDLIKLRGSSKWYGGELKIEGYGPDAEVQIIIPEHATISGSKANPEEVSQAARPDANMTTSVQPDPPARAPARSKQQRARFT